MPIIARTSCCTIGIRVEPPTSTTSSISLGVSPASFKARLTGTRNRPNKSSHKPSNWERVRRVSKWTGPCSVAAMKGKLISVTLTAESSILAFSAASIKRCKDCRSLLKSTFSCSRNCSANQSTIFLSKSLPPS